jgi:hypothetical protein
MIEILHFKKGAKIIELNTAVTYLNVPGELNVPLWERKHGKEPLDWLSSIVFGEHLDGDRLGARFADVF